MRKRNLSEFSEDVAEFFCVVFVSLSTLTLEYKFLKNRIWIPKKIVRRIELCNSSAIHHENAIAMHDGVNAMRDGNHSTILREAER